METRIEAGNLRHIGQPFSHCFNSCQIIGLMQRSERYQTAKFSQDLGRYYCRPGEPRSAMHDTMSNTHDLRTTIARLEPRSQSIDCSLTVVHLGSKLPINEVSAASIL